MSTGTHRFGDVAGGAEFPQLEVAGVLGDGLAEHLCGGGLSLGLHDLLLLLLQRAVHHEGRALSLLLRDLFIEQDDESTTSLSPLSQCRIMIDLSSEVMSRIFWLS